ncbi:MAG: TRAP transporter substrate-binding protein DctP [Parasporobacterium sp.]|nr:TRAP transporter substrate-binding protein DctP [Parasporobacterium sp.]
MKKKILSMILAFALLITCFSMTAFAGEADNTVYNLSMTIHVSQTTAHCKALDEWAARVAEKSNGRLNIVINYGGTLASGPDAVEFVQQGGCDIAWSTVSLNAAMFKYCNILSMYGEELSNAELATYVYMNMSRNNEAFANEFSSVGLTLLGAHGMTPSLIAGNGDKIETVEDFKGESIMSISKTCISVLEGLGAAVQGVTTADLYDNFAKNVVQASLVDASLYSAMQIYEQFAWMNTYNYNSALAFIVMNADKFNSLPEDLQQILMEEFETVSMACAQYTDEDFTNFVENVIPENNVEVYGTSDEVIAAVNEQLAAAIETPWEEACAAAGYDTEAIRSEVEALIEEGRATYGESYDWFK